MVKWLHITYSQGQRQVMRLMEITLFWPAITGRLGNIMGKQFSQHIAPMHLNTDG